MKNKPQWIAEVYKIIGGQDHLGLGSVSSDHILEGLTPGIIALTPHPRYYIFYTFLLDEFWRRDLSRNNVNFIRFYRPREFIFSLGANLCNHPEHKYMHSIMGGQKTSPLANKKQDLYNTDYDYIKNRLGGYGLYYRSAIRRLGWIIPKGQPPLPPVDAPTPEGKKIAEIFRNAVKDTEYYKSFFNENNIDIPRDVIEGYISKSCLCQLQLDNSLERNYALYYFIGKEKDNESHLRRKTFELFLDLAQQTQGLILTDDVFRQLLYYGSTDDGYSYKPHRRVHNTYLKWRLYQVREYYGFALNSMWFYLCNWGKDKSNFLPIEIEDFWKHITDNLSFKKLSKHLSIDSPTINKNSKFTELLEWIKNVVGNKKKFDDECKIDSLINEYKVYNLSKINNFSFETMVLGMLVILSLIYLRFRDAEKEMANLWEISKMGGYDRLSLDLFIKTLDRKLKNKNISIIEIIKWLFMDFIIEQHIKIASNKLPENTFRFIIEGNKIIFFEIENSSPTFNTSRFEAVSTIVYELGLCGNFRDKNHSLTSDGLKIINGEIPKWNF
ncbi:MAG: hypothetical protein HQ569_08590 [Actinobacteria bacterium]|nr:hypothetical protein [Actinomycetota bacterium]